MPFVKEAFKTDYKRIRRKALIHIPPKLMQILILSEGDEVDLRAEASKLVVEPVTARKRIRLSAEIVDELVDRKDLK